MYDIMKNTTKEKMIESILKKYNIESRLENRIITIDLLIPQTMMMHLE